MAASRTSEPSDPALDSGPDGRSLLQVRIALLGRILLFLALFYWVGFLAQWSNEPSMGLRVALGHALSIPSALLFGTYLTIWLVARGRKRSLATLRGLEVFLHLMYGLIFGFGWKIHPAPAILTYDVLLGILLLLALRALVVPSSWQRTAVLGALTCFPITLSVALWGQHFTPATIQHATLIGTYVNWSLMSIAFSAVASGILYGMRRAVRDARSLGQYTLLEPLGQGGMGVVYHARHAMLRRPTAIKVLSVDGNAGSLDRFEREVQQLARLAHPNIVTVYDYGRTEDGSLYYAMELLDGANLERMVRIDGPLPAARVVHLVIQACRALSEAHAAGLVHRDIKPANLFVSRHWGAPDALKVLDFGLVKELRGAVALTSDGAIMGTPLYMAPESGMRPDLVDERSDLYSLGAVAYFLLTGRPVFDGKNPFEVIMHHAQTAPEPPSRRAEVPADLEAIVLRCLAKDPDARFESADVLRLHLEDCACAGRWLSSDARAWWIAHELGLRRAEPALPVHHTQLCIEARRRRLATAGDETRDTMQPLR